MNTSIQNEKCINYHGAQPQTTGRPSRALTASVARLRRLAAASPAVPRAVEGDVAVDLGLGSRRARVREEELGGVVLEGLAAPQQDAQDHQGVARLVRAQVHAGGRAEGLLHAGVAVGWMAVGPTGRALVLGWDNRSEPAGFMGPVRLQHGQPLRCGPVRTL